MEDRHVVESPVDPSFPEGHLLAVFDGHRGSEAAEFSAQNLRAVLATTLGDSSGESCLKVHLPFSQHSLSVESHLYSKIC